MDDTNKLLAASILIHKQASFLGTGARLAFKNLGNVAKKLAPTVGAKKPLPARGIDVFSAARPQDAMPMRKFFKNIIDDSRNAAGAPKFSPARADLAETLRTIRNRQYSPSVGTYAKVNWKGNPINF